MMSCARRLLPAVLLALLAVVAAADDVLVLENGREVRGTVLEETDDAVKLGIAGGSIWFPKAGVREIRRDGATAGAAARPAVRSEYALLYTDGERCGTRTLRFLPEGAGGARDTRQWEEHVVFLGKDGRPELEVRTLERSRADYSPVMFQVRESTPGGEPRLIRGRALGAVLEVAVTVAGETETTLTDLPAGSRFPFAAREEFVADDVDAAGVHVFDLRDRRFRDIVYRTAGERVVDQDGTAVTARVIHRRRGEIQETEWVAPDGRALLADLNGSGLRALAASAEAVAAVSAGQPDRVFGQDSAARTRYADPVEGFEIKKPDPAWLFERPAVPGGGALVMVRNAALGASVDVLRDLSPPPDLTLERAGAALERVLRAHAPDLEVLAGGVREAEGDLPRRFVLEARATTKGEKTHTLAHVRIVGEREYWLLAACPEPRFGLLRTDLETILASFRVTPPAAAAESDDAHR